MNFVEKRKVAIESLKRLGIRKGTYAPPAFRVLWFLGVSVPPPHFNSFVGNALILGSSFSAIYGLFMGLKFLLEDRHASPLQLAIDLPFICGTVPLGVIFGLSMAWYYSSAAKKCHLQPWRNI